MEEEEALLVGFAPQTKTIHIQYGNSDHKYHIGNSSQVYKLRDRLKATLLLKNIPSTLLRFVSESKKQLVALDQHFYDNLGSEEFLSLRKYVWVSLLFPLTVFFSHLRKGLVGTLTCRVSFT